MEKLLYGRKDRLIKERQHDVYRSRAKNSTPSLCEECGAVYANGRWVWGVEPTDPEFTTCPACRRIKEGLAAGQVEVRGRFFVDHREEILNLVRNIERKERANHPLERIMQIEDQSEGVQIQTTGLHLARGIGTALSRAYHGAVAIHYLDSENFVLVQWSRDE